MKKIRYRIKGEQLIVKVRISPNEKVEEPIKNILMNHFVNGLLRLGNVKRFSLEYVGMPCITLTQFLAKPMTEADFQKIIYQILHISRYLKENNLHFNHLLFDLNHIFINENVKELQFICFPFAKESDKQDFLSLIKNIIYFATFENSKQSNFVSAFYKFINACPDYSENAIENFLIKNQFASSSMNLMDFSDYYGDELSEDTQPLEADELEEDTVPIDEDAISEDTEPVNEDELEEEIKPEKNDFFSSIDNDAYVYASAEEDEIEDTIDYDGFSDDEEYDEDTVVYEEENVPYLLNEATNEKIMIRNSVFRVGKQASSVDYCIDNKAVSKHHFSIINRNNQFYIIDPGSKNGTYLNGVAIPPKIETELKNGASIRLAGEILSFWIGLAED